MMLLKMNSQKTLIERKFTHLQGEHPPWEENGGDDDVDGIEMQPEFKASVLFAREAKSGVEINSDLLQHVGGRYHGGDREVCNASESGHRISTVIRTSRVLKHFLLSTVPALSRTQA